MSNFAANAARRVLDWPAKRALAGQINKSAADLMRMPDNRSMWPRYRKATDSDSSFYLEYSSNGNKVDSLVFHDGLQLHNLAIDNLMKLSDDALKSLYTALTTRRRSGHLQLSDEQSAPTYAPGTRRP